MCGEHEVKLLFCFVLFLKLKKTQGAKVNMKNICLCSNAGTVSTNMNYWLRAHTVREIIYLEIIAFTFV